MSISRLLAKVTKAKSYLLTSFKIAREFWRRIRSSAQSRITLNFPFLSVIDAGGVSYGDHLDRCFPHLGILPAGDSTVTQPIDIIYVSDFQMIGL